MPQKTKNKSKFQPQLSLMLNKMSRNLPCIKWVWSHKCLPLLYKNWHACHTTLPHGERRLWNNVGLVSFHFGPTFWGRILQVLLIIMCLEEALWVHFLGGLLHATFLIWTIACLNWHLRSRKLWPTFWQRHLFTCDTCH
jgi:hypothetical protein